MALWLGGRGFGVEREEQQSEIERTKKYISLEKIRIVWLIFKYTLYITHSKEFAGNQGKHQN